MFTDDDRSRVQDAIRQHDQALFAHILTPDLFFQAAQLSGLPLIRSPLNLINLVCLAVRAARHPDKSFAEILGLPLQTLQDNEQFPSSDLAHLLDDAQQRRRSAPHRRQRSRHDPRSGAPERVSEQAFSQARQRMPTAFWVALFFLLGEEFERLHGAVLRWQQFRLLAADGTCVKLPDYPALRLHFGKASNASGGHNAQAQLLLLPFPLARLPYAWALEPLTVGEVTLARRLLQGLRSDDLVLLDAGFLSYGLLCQIASQGASFVVRLCKRLNRRVVKRLGSANDVLVRWQPKDSRGQWRKEGLPRDRMLRLLTYKVRGFRPLQLLTNVLSEQTVSREQFWGLTTSAEGEVLTKGVYQWRWEIETTYRELKRGQQLEGGLRSRTPAGIFYEVAGHLLYYLLLRWLLVEAAAEAGVSPLRLSFHEALNELVTLWPQAVTASAGWLAEVLQPRLRQRVARHRVAERSGRCYPRSKKGRKASKRCADRQAKQAKRRRPHKTKKRIWYGEGWNLGGPTSQPTATGQG
jgi:Transposase DDE domain